MPLSGSGRPAKECEEKPPSQAWSQQHLMPVNIPEQQQPREPELASGLEEPAALQTWSDATAAERIASV